jgi:carbamoyltransferase
MTIVGLGGLQGDGGCAILKDGTLRAAIEESKLNHGARGGIPEMAIAECLRLAGVTREAVDCVAVVRPVDPALHSPLRALFPQAEVAVVEHHLAHAASSFFASPFESATVLTLDRTGDFHCGARWKAQGNQLQLEKEWQYPDSPAAFYSAVTDLLGFRAGGDEHKVQWLSASGDDRFETLFHEIMGESGHPDASFFDGNRGASGGFNAKMFTRLGLADGAPVPAALAPSVARGMQRAVEDTVLTMAGEGENLCLAGGLFYNALLVEFLERSGRWKNVFVQPAAGNSGTALGGAFYLWHQRQHHTHRAGASSLLLGPSYSQEDIKKVLENCKLRFRYLRSSNEAIATAVGMLGERKIVAWMQGRMEFGPRALGNRSILASPLDPYSTENLNVFIKHREPFRKFAASVPAEVAAEYFEAGPNARNLATVGRVKPAHRKTFAAAILGQDIVRVHTVAEADNPLYHRLLHEAGKATGLPVLYNTSFNLFGAPLVSTPRDAVRSFYSSGIDALLVGNFVVEK